MSRVLVVEDELKIRRSLELGLRGEGYEVVTAATGEEGYVCATNQAVDCMVLDILLPGRDGLQVLAILILTARDQELDVVAGLDAGADDYLVKPFAFAELLARLRVLLRRGRVEQETVLRAGDLELNLIDRQASRGGVEIPLTQREFEVLAYLVGHKNAVVTREMLGREVWREPDHALTNVIDVYINLLRRKVEKPGQPPLIHTLRGVGYSLREGS